MSSVSQTDELTTAMLHRAGFSLGSNVGERLALLEQACDHLSELFGDLRLSQVYETEPVGCPEGSPWYLNACVEVSTDKSPREILLLCQQIEQKLGRERHGLYGEPRTCDIDFLYYDRMVLGTPELTLPHPRLLQREFVLRPLCDIDSLLTLPGQTLTVGELLGQLPPGPVVKPFPL